MHVIEEIEREYAKELAEKRAVPDFAPGDTVRVNVGVREGDKERIQGYEGVVIGRSGPGINESFVVRKISYGEGVERVFPMYSPMIESIEVKRRGKVRRAKLYYLRSRRGKAARIPEKQDFRNSARKGAGKSTAKNTKTDTPLFSPPEGTPDDLTRISGVGEVLAKRLHGLGVTRFEQVANFSDEDIAKVDERLNFKGRILREDWISQARELVREAEAENAMGTQAESSAKNAGKETKE